MSQFKNHNTENNMVQINDFPLPPEFPDGKEFTKQKFTKLVLKKAPKFNSFCIREIVDKLELNEIEKKQFKHLNLNIRSELINSGLVEFFVKGSTDIILTEQGRNFFDKKHSEIIIAENYIGGDNYGIQSSKSDFINPAIQNASKITVHNNPKRSFLEIASWVFGIVVAIIVIYEFILK